MRALDSTTTIPTQFSTRLEDCCAPAPRTPTSWTCRSRSASRSVELGEQLLRSRELISIAQQLGDLVPVRRLVQIDADPSARTDIRWLEEPLGRGPDHELLVARRGLAPHAVSPPAMMIARAGEHGEELVLH